MTWGPYAFEIVKVDPPACDLRDEEERKREKEKGRRKTSFVDETRLPDERELGATSLALLFFSPKGRYLSTDSFILLFNLRYVSELSTLTISTFIIY